MQTLGANRRSVMVVPWAEEPRTPAHRDAGSHANAAVALNECNRAPSIQRPPSGAPMGERSRDARTPMIVGALLAGATAVLGIRDPHRGGYGVCPILALTGFPCATCGGLRAVHDMVNGDFGGAWGMNPLLTIGLPVLALVWATWTFRAATGRRAWQPPAWLWIAIAVVLIGFTVLRNIPALQGALGPG